MFCFCYVGKWIVFEKKEPTYQKTLKFFKNPVFLIKKFERDNEYLTIFKNCSWKRVSNPPPVDYLFVVSRHLGIMQVTNNSGRFCASWEKSGKGKELRPLNWILSFQKIFGRKIIIIVHSMEMMTLVRQPEILRWFTKLIVQIWVPLLFSPCGWAHWNSHPALLSLILGKLAFCNNSVHYFLDNLDYVDSS